MYVQESIYIVKRINNISTVDVLKICEIFRIVIKINI